jgi:deazaflavin-dependent oxidoreductase (nitroreductase family)
MMITLATTGRRSGVLQEVTLYAFSEGDALVVTGSKGGAANDPAWALNLRADPMARVRRGRQESDMRAREATGDERARLWRLVCQQFPMYEAYQRRTARQFPVFVLEPHSDPDVR